MPRLERLLTQFRFTSVARQFRDHPALAEPAAMGQPRE
jgi:hypothetical protein